MKQGLSFFPSHLSIGVTKYKSDGCKEVAFARPIAPDDNIVFRRKWINLRLIFVTDFKVSMRLSSSCPLGVVPFEALDDDLLDIHFDRANSRGASNYLIILSNLSWRNSVVNRYRYLWAATRRTERALVLPKLRRH